MNKKILFIGCVESSFALLKCLIENQANIICVITKKSKYNTDYMDLSPLAKEHNIPIHFVDNINDDKNIQYIKKLEPDLIYCFGWSQLLSTQLINIAKIDVVGFHPAKLPYNKGRHPIIWSLVLGLKSTASTFFSMVEEADAGDILSQEDITIKEEDDAKTLYDKVVSVAEKQIVKLTEDFEKDCVNRIPQLPIGNSWRKRTSEDGRIDWRMSNDSIFNLVRALYHPYPGASFFYKDKEIKVWKVKKLEWIPNIEPGKIVKVLDNNEFIVKTGVGAIQVIECDFVDIKEGEYLK